MNTLSPELLLSAYAQGYFPMASSRDAKEVNWYYPEHRGVMPLHDFHAPKSLTKFIKKNPYTLTMDKNFRAVITACADAPREADGGTWINDEIINAYCELHSLGNAHSVEVWDAGDECQVSDEGGQQTDSALSAPHGANSRRAPEAKGKLVGGLYGVSLGKAFFGESMFSHKTNASKVALVHLVEYLKAHNYSLLDTQYVNEHLMQFGVQEIPREDYLALLANALGVADRT